MVNFKAFKDILDMSLRSKYGWADTWPSFLDGRWFSIAGEDWPNAFDDNTGHLKLHPQTVKKLLRDELAEQIDYAEAGEMWGRGQFKHRPQIKLRLTQKGIDLVFTREMKIRQGAQAIIDWGASLAQDYLESILEDHFYGETNEDFWDLAQDALERAQMVEIPEVEGDE